MPDPLGPCRTCSCCGRFPAMYGSNLCRSCTAELDEPGTPERGIDDPPAMNDAEGAD